MNSIPTTPQSWNRNPDGYVKHQHLLVQLVEWLESQGAEVEVPEDTGSWDKGVDLIVNGSRLDLKSFDVDLYGNSYTWRSSFYRGRRAPLYDGSLTDWFVHASDLHPSEWIVGRRSGLRTSKYGFAPYYFTEDCSTMGQLIKCH